MASNAVPSLDRFCAGIASTNPSDVFATLTAVCASLESVLTSSPQAQDDQGTDQREAHHSADGAPPGIYGSPAALMLGEYLESSKDCDDLFEALERQKNQWKFQGLTEAIVDTLRWIISLSGWDSSLRGLGIFLVKKIMAQHARPIYQNLSSDRPRVVKVTLRLLTAMVSQSLASARDVQQTFNFTFKPVEKLPSRRGEGDADDIRTHFVRFALAFFRWEDPHLTKHVLEIKGFIPSIIRGLAADSPHTVSLVLNTLLVRVVRNRALPRKVKVSFFNPSVLEQFAKMYECVSADSVSKSNVNGDPRMDTHAFLVEVCCAPDGGLWFPDPKWTASRAPAPANERGKTRNPILLKFIQALPSANEDLLVQELVLTILTRCPDIVQPYLAAVTLSMEPRLSFRWLANVNMVTKILTRTPQPPFAAKAAPRSAGGILERVVPAVLTRQALTLGLQHASPLVRYTTLGALVTIFAEADKALASAVRASQGAAHAQVPVWDSFFRQFREGLRRRLPDLQTVLARRQHDQPTAAEGVPQAQQLAYARILAVLRGYQKHVPEAFVESRFDYGKLVPPLAVLLSLPAPSQLALAEVLAQAVGFKWQGKAADAAVPASVGKQQPKQQQQQQQQQQQTQQARSVARSHMSALMHLLTTTDVQPVRVALRKFAAAALADTGLFDGSAAVRGEISEWIGALWADDTVISFLDTVIAAAVKDPYPHIDAVSDAFKSAREVDAAASASATSVPFSPLMASALSHAFSGLDAVGNVGTLRPVMDYVRCVLAGIGRTQVSTLPLEALVHSLSVLPSTTTADANAKLRRDSFAGELMSVLGALRAGFSPVPPAEVEKSGSKHAAAIDVQLADIAAGSSVSALDELCVSVGAAPWAVLVPRLAHVAAACNKYASVHAALVRRMSAMNCGSSFLSSPAVEEALHGAVAGDESFGVTTASETMRFLLSLPFSVAFAHCSSVSAIGRPHVVSYLMRTLGNGGGGLASAFHHVLLRLSSLVHKSKHGDCDELNARAINALYALLGEVLSRCATEEGGVDTAAGLMRAYVSNPMVEERFLAGENVADVSGLVTCGSTHLAAELHALLAAAEEQSTTDVAAVLSPLLSRITRAVSGVIERFCATATASTAVETPHKKGKNNAPVVASVASTDADKDASIVALFSVYRSMLSRDDASKMTLDLLALPSSAFGTSQGLSSGWTAWSLLVLMLGRTGDAESSLRPASVRALSAGAPLVLSRDGFEKLTQLMRTCPSPSIDRVVVDILVASSRKGAVSSEDYAVVAQGDVLSFCLTAPTNDLRLRAASMLVRASPLAKHLFEDSLLAADARIAHPLFSTPMRCLDLATAYLEAVGISASHRAAHLPSLSATESAVAVLIADALFDSLVASVTQFDDDDSAIETLLYRLVRAVPARAPRLLSAVTTAAASARKWTGIAARIASFICTCAYEPVRAVDAMDVDGVPHHIEDANIGHLRTLFVSSALDALSRTFTAHADGQIESDAETAVIDAVSASVEHVSPDERNKKMFEDHVTEYVAAAARHRIASPQAISLIRKLLSLEGSSWGRRAALIALDTVTDAKEFEDVLLREDEEDGEINDDMRMQQDDHNDDAAGVSIGMHVTATGGVGDASRRISAKESLVHLLSDLATRYAPECCRAHILPVLLAAYTASLGRCDRLLLRLFAAYEAAGVSVGEDAFVFGPGSLDRRKERKAEFATAKGLSLRGLAHEVVDSIDPQRMAFTSEHLPPSAEMDPAADISSIPAEVARGCYDPGFILPLLSQVMSSNDPPDCRRLLESDCLSVIVASLAVRSESVRAAAYDALGLFYSLVDAARFREKPQIFLLLSAFKNSITIENERVPAVIAAFVCNCVRLLLRPEHFLYATVNKFVLQRPALDLRDVPLFFALFNSSASAGGYKKERGWMLRLLYAGLRDGIDRRVYGRRHVFELLLSFLDSALSHDGGARKAGIRVIHRACAVPTAAEELVRQHGFVAWLHAACTTSQRQGGAAAETFYGALLPTAILLIRTLSQSGAMYLPEEFVWLARTSIDWLCGFSAPDAHIVGSVITLVASVVAFARAHAASHYGPAVSRDSLFGDISVAHVARLIMAWEKAYGPAVASASTDTPKHSDDASIGLHTAGLLIDIVSSVVIPRHADSLASDAPASDSSANTPTTLSCCLAVIEWGAGLISLHSSLGAHRAASFALWCTASFIRDRKLTAWLATHGSHGSAVRALLSLYNAAPAIDSPSTRTQFFSNLNSAFLVLVARAREIGFAAARSAEAASAVDAHTIVQTAMSPAYGRHVAVSPDGAVVSLMTLLPHPTSLHAADGDADPSSTVVSCTCGVCGDSVAAANGMLSLFVRELWSGAPSAALFEGCVDRYARAQSHRAGSDDKCLARLLGRR